MAISGCHIIAGEYSREDNRTFTSVDPRRKAAGSVLFYNATPQEVDRAVTAAATAFETTRHYPAHTLADFLDRVADEIEAVGDDLLQTADMETGLGIPRLTSERARTTGQLRAFGKLLREGSYVEAIIDTAQPDRKPTPRPDIRRMLFPIGPVAVFSASNFPFAFSVAGGDTASAFAAGCPVIVKGHPGHPATSELVGQAITHAVNTAGFPLGFFSLLQGESIEVGQTLVQHPKLEAVGFTGSLRAGRALFDLAARRLRPIPIYAEMSSVNPTILLQGAIAAGGDGLAEQLVASVTIGAGQFCTNPGLILVQDAPESREFIELVRQRMESREPGVLLNANVERGLTLAVEQTLSHPGVRRLTGGTVVEGEGYCYANTVLQTTSAVFRSNKALQAEHFGPVTLFVVCESLEDLKATASSLHGSLTASIHARDDDLTAGGELADLLREKAGRLIWNGFPTGVEVVYAMQHGGPYPATTAPASTSVGMTAIKRFMRPVAFQNMPQPLLPDALKDGNPLNIWRIVNDELTRTPVR
ncbi:MAG TPA: aldehyde dehydrogenase (NADP(+)) [Aggregatilineaceae bacterium]|nr:aldehyde dehydrogenase (NADP(+)) [Aggregatilineaceae bacterium]